MRANSEPTRVLCKGVSVLDSLIGPQRNLDGPLAHDVQSAMRERVLQRGGVAAELRCDCESCRIDVSDRGEHEGYKALDVSDGGGSKGFRLQTCVRVVDDRAVSSTCRIPSDQAHATSDGKATVYRRPCP